MFSRFHEDLNKKRYRAATDLQSDLCNLSTCAIYMNIKQYLGLKEKFVFPLWMNATVTIFQSCQESTTTSWISFNLPYGEGHIMCLAL